MLEKYCTTNIQYNNIKLLCKGSLANSEAMLNAAVYDFGTTPSAIHLP